MKKVNLLIATLLLIFTCSTLSLAQEATAWQEIKGRILDNDTNDALEQATITLKGTNRSTVSNKEGKFSLKIPKSLEGQQLVVQAIGYKKTEIAVAQYAGKPLKIFLENNTITLDGANIVAYTDAADLVKRVFKNRQQNYLNDKTVMTAFYRETIKKRSKNASLAEAVVNIYKQPYGNSVKDQIKMLKSRKDTDYSRLDTIALKLQGGPFSTLFVDIVKYPEYIFTPVTLDAYRFKFDNLTEVNGENVYVVNFKQRDEVTTPLYEGKLYIGASNLALVKATYALKLVNTKEVNQMFIRSKPANVKIKPRQISYEVNYRQKEGKWLYGYSKADLSFEVKKRRKLFKSIYSLSCEMAVTDWQSQSLSNSTPNALAIDEYIIMADHNTGFGDPDFWGKYNVIEPEKSIETAIKKIQRKLIKDQKTGAGLGSR